MHNTKICKQCQQPFRVFLRKDGKNYNLSKRSYCLICSPYGKLTKNSKPIIDGKRECSRCREMKPLIDFKPRSNSKHLRSCCQPCEVERVTEYGRLLKQKAVDYKGGKCQKCGYDKCLRALTFHHLNPEVKEFTIAKRKSLNWEDTKRELDKCQLLCANCHAEVHD